MMRHRYAVLTVVTLFACVLVLSLPGFASVLKHDQHAPSPIKGVHNNYSPSKLSPLIYAQNTDLGGAFASQFDTNGLGNFATTFDNFTLGSNFNIDEFAWIGSYFNPQGSQGTITAFTLNFYADAAGIPGALLWTGTGSGNFNETLIGPDAQGDLTFMYDGLLATPFAASAGVQYWVSIVPDSGFPPQWGWETGTGGDGAAYQVFFGSGGPITADLSFALYGTAQTSVPEPGSLILMGTGLLGLAGVIRRKLS